MDEKWGVLSPKASLTLIRILGLILLSLLWIGSQSNNVGVVLLLFLAILTLARERFSLPKWTLILYQLACILTIPFWPQASYALLIPVFESVIQGSTLYGLPGVIITFLLFEQSMLLLVATVIVALMAWIIKSWFEDAKRYDRESDEQRKDRYELELLKDELLLANVEVALLAEVAERNRIAQELHDDVGHEITATVLAMQAFEQLWKEGDDGAEVLFYEAQKRLSNSALQLRERVHNMKPIKSIGIDHFEEICRMFNYCPLDFNIYGDTSRIPVYLWNILEPCLKESLTNIVKHSNATEVKVILDVNPHILRLSIHDNGQEVNNKSIGIGIRNLRQRARAVGGYISIDTSDGLNLICVLPIDKEVD